MPYVLAALALGIAGAWLAFAPGRANGSHWTVLGYGITMAPLAVLALVRMVRAKEVRELLQPRWGDISLGVGSGLLLYAATWVVRATVTPVGSRREGWLMRVYAQIGDPEIIQRNLTLFGLAMLIVAVMDEVAWRGLVLPVLNERFGTRRGWIVCGAVYGLTLAPTLWWLRDPAGPNPLVFAAGLAGGMVWSYLATRSSRLVPSILSHAMYVWFVVAQFRLFTIGS